MPRSFGGVLATVCALSLTTLACEERAPQASSAPGTRTDAAPAQLDAQAPAADALSPAPDALADFALTPPPLPLPARLMNLGSSASAPAVFAAVAVDRRGPRLPPLHQNGLESSSDRH